MNKGAKFQYLITLHLAPPFLAPIQVQYSIIIALFSPHLFALLK